MLKMTTVTDWTLRLFLVGSIGYCTIPSICLRAQESAQADNLRTGYISKGFAKGRLNILTLTNPLKLEEANEVPIELHGYKVHSVHVRVSYNDGYASRYPGFAQMDVPIMYHRDGSAFISIIPENLGKLHLQIDVDFDDGYFDVAKLDTAEVVLPDRKPENFYVNVGSHGTLYLDLRKAKGVVIDPMAVYTGAAHPVPIPTEYLRFKIIKENESNPPISLDQSTGMIMALNYGHALVETTFGDLSTLNCVSVQEDASSGANSLDCSELVPTGMTPPKTGLEDVPRQLEEMLNKPRMQQLQH
jgi:hypothetical protein